MVMNTGLTLQVCDDSDLNHNSGDVDLIGIDVFIDISSFSAPVSLWMTNIELVILSLPKYMCISVLWVKWNMNVIV